MKKSVIKALEDYKDVKDGVLFPHSLNKNTIPRKK